MSFPCCVLIFLSSFKITSTDLFCLDLFLLFFPISLVSHKFLTYHSSPILTKWNHINFLSCTDSFTDFIPYFPCILIYSLFNPSILLRYFTFAAFLSISNSVHHTVAPGSTWTYRWISLFSWLYLCVWEMSSEMHNIFHLLLFNLSCVLYLLLILFLLIMLIILAIYFLNMYISNCNPTFQFKTFSVSVKVQKCINIYKILRGTIEKPSDISTVGQIKCYFC